MAVGDVETLTDAELIAELAEYGEDIKLPIKANKRPILIKKLNHLKARAKQQESLNKSVKNKISTPLTAQPPTPARGRGTTRSSRSTAGPSRNNDSVEANPAGRSSQTTRLRSRQPTLDTFSSDDSDTEPLTTYSSESQHYSAADNDSFLERSVATSKRPISNFSDSILRTIRRRTGEQSPPQRRTRRSNVFELSAEENRLSDSLNELSKYPSNKANTNDDSPTPSPARSKLYPNLSSFISLRGKDTKLTKDNFESSDDDLEDASTYEVENKSVNTSFPQINLSSRGRSPTLSNSSATEARVYLPRKRNDGRDRVQQYTSAIADHFPYFLVAIVVLFFLALLGTYAANHRDLIYSLISPNNIGSKDEMLLALNDVPDENTYTKGEINRAIDYITVILAELSRQKGEVMCETKNPGYEFMDVDSLKKKIELDTVSEMTAHRLLKCCLEHIMVNPHWNIRGFTKNGSQASAANDVFKLASTVGSMSWSCRLWRSASTVLYGLFIAMIAIFAIGLCVLFMHRRSKKKEQEQKEMFTMVEKIIDVLQEHHEQTKSEGAPAHLAVQHVRDQLLPPAHRKRLQPIWDAAFDFISANESRIRLETRLIHGDEFEVWHWLPQTTTNGKIWQGQAFGELNDSSNTQRMICPTPCLKIRNMFDSNVESEEGWEDVVVDAVLEKLRGVQHVVHVFVDAESSEGCVYLKCDSRQAAGMARNALHGWWFDGRLVTAKHLKLEHYHKRWPEAREAHRPLAPSTPGNLSLSRPYHRSLLEVT